jgi:hypothetical protein
MCSATRAIVDLRRTWIVADLLHQKTVAAARASTINPYASYFYRLQFKRIDGDGIKTHWREWYPWMAKLGDEYKAHPTPPNN